MATAVLRPATAADMPVVADIWHTGWHDAHAGHVPDRLTELRTLPAFRERAAARVAETTVADVDGEVVGFTMVIGDEVEQLFVAREQRGAGVAATLLSEAEAQVAAQGHDVAWLSVVIGNARARAFYARQGWSDTGDLPYEVTAFGETFTSPCRRYEKRVR